MPRRPWLLVVLCALATALAIPLLAIPPLPRQGGAAQKNPPAGVEERIRHVETGLVSIPERPSIEHYVAIVREKAILRGVINVSRAAIANALDGGRAKAVVSVLANHLLDLQADAPQRPFKSLAEVTLPAWDRLQQGRNQEQALGLPTSLSKLDEMTTGIRPGELWIAAGRPGSGKSAFASQVAGENAQLVNVWRCFRLR
jgi:replicative DNA helicase